MKNPSALSDETLQLIDQLLGGYETALENILYRHRNPTQDLKEIREARQAIEYALNGPTDEEMQAAFEEWSQTGNDGDVRT